MEGQGGLWYISGMKPIKMLLFALWLALVALACNLTSPPSAPTIAPRASATPPPTIGYSTLSPEELPQVAATSIASADADLLNLANQIDTDRLMLHVDTLQNFGTRHVNSDYNRSDWELARQSVTSATSSIRFRASPMDGWWSSSSHFNWNGPG